MADWVLERSATIQRDAMGKPIPVKKERTPPVRRSSLLLT